MENQLLASAASFSLLPLHRIIDGWDFKRRTWNTTYSFRSQTKLLILKMIFFFNITLLLLELQVHMYITYAEPTIPIFCHTIHYSLNLQPGSKFCNIHFQKSKLLICWHISALCMCVLSTSTQPCMKDKFCAICLTEYSCK